MKSRLIMRTTPATRERLEEAAAASGRTLSQEAEHQLERALSRDDVTIKIAEVRPSDLLIFRYPGYITPEMAEDLHGRLGSRLENLGLKCAGILILGNGALVEVLRPEDEAA